MLTLNYPVSKWMEISILLGGNLNEATDDQTIAAQNALADKLIAAIGALDNDVDLPIGFTFDEYNLVRTVLYA